MKRRDFLAASGAVLAMPFLARGAFAALGGRALPIPPLVETGADQTVLTAAPGQSAFLDGAMTPSWGYSQAFLGPTLRMKRGQTARVRLENRLDFAVTSHWHGLHVPGKDDGGPMLEVTKGGAWSPDLEIDQPASTQWYHSHSHGITAEQVYGGLAGMIQIIDPEAGASGLPENYGVDDLPLIVQDRAFTEGGGLLYIKRGPALMHGFRGGEILVNGAIRPEASVPSGLVRLRLLNGSNARIYHFSFEDGRGFHQVASEGGLLAAPVALQSLSLAPAQRAEIVVDFSDGGPVRLISGPDTNDPMAGGGMMGGMMGGMAAMLPPGPDQIEERPGHFEVMRFAPDGQPGKVAGLPAALPAAAPPDFGEPVRRRHFELSMMGGMGMGMGGRGGGMTINGKPFKMGRIDTEMRLGETERWTIVGDRMLHPFHVHATHFQVIRNGGRPVDPALGLSDTVLVDGEAEILIRVNRAAGADIPYMYHCHILEHEDAGMMGNFTVS